MVKYLDFAQFFVTPNHGPLTPDYENAIREFHAMFPRGALASAAQLLGLSAECLNDLPPSPLFHELEAIVAGQGMSPKDRSEMMDVALTMFLERIHVDIDRHRMYGRVLGHFTAKPLEIEGTQPRSATIRTHRRLNLRGNWHAAAGPIIQEGDQVTAVSMPLFLDGAPDCSEVRRARAVAARLSTPWQNVFRPYADDLARAVLAEGRPLRVVEVRTTGVCQHIAFLDAIGVHPDADADTLRELTDTWISCRLGEQAIPERFLPAEHLLRLVQGSTLKSYMQHARHFWQTVRGDHEGAAIVREVDFEAKSHSRWNTPRTADAMEALLKARRANDVEACKAIYLFLTGVPPQVLAALLWSQIQWHAESQMWFLALPRLDGTEGTHAVPIRWGGDFLGAQKRIMEGSGQPHVFPSLRRSKASDATPRGPRPLSSLNEAVQRHSSLCGDDLRYVALADWAFRVDDPAILRHVAYQRSAGRCTAVWDQVADWWLRGVSPTMRDVTLPQQPGNQHCPSCNDSNPLGKLRCGSCGYTLAEAVPTEADDLAADIIRRIRRLNALGGKP